MQRLPGVSAGSLGLAESKYSIHQASLVWRAVEAAMGIVGPAKVALLASMLLWPGYLPAQSASPAGEVAAVVVWAFGTPQDRPRGGLFLGNPVFVQERLETVENGALHVELADGTQLRLGSASSVVIDNFVYAGQASAGAFLASVAAGVCRFVTGAVNEAHFVVTTPTASLVPRGTEFSVWVAADGTTTLWVQQGTVVATPKSGAAPAAVNGGEIVAIAAAGPIKLDAPRPAPDPGLRTTPEILRRKLRNNL